MDQTTKAYLDAVQVALRDVQGANPKWLTDQRALAVVLEAQLHCAAAIVNELAELRRAMEKARG